MYSAVFKLFISGVPSLGGVGGKLSTWEFELAVVSEPDGCADRSPAGFVWLKGLPVLKGVIQFEGGRILADSEIQGWKVGWNVLQT